MPFTADELESTMGAVEDQVLPGDVAAELRQRRMQAAPGEIVWQAPTADLRASTHPDPVNDPVPSAQRRARDAQEYFEASTAQTRALSEDIARDFDEDAIYRSMNPHVDFAVRETFGPLPTEPQILRAVDIASKAADLVGGDRDRQHGAKADNFERIAAVWNAWLSIRKEQAAPLSGHDVGCMMAMMKLARTQSGNLNTDDYVDAAGYAACAGEVAQEMG